MKIHGSFFAVVAALGLGALAYYIAPSAETVIAEIPAAHQAVAEAIAPEPVKDTREFIPHRALYELSLLSSKAQGRVNNVSGKMMFQWDDACDGWTIEQRLDMDFQYEGDGGAQNSKTSLATWEAKDASLFRFNVRRETNGEVTEIYRGSAVKASAGNKEAATAHYTAPATRDVQLSSATLFPSIHTLELLRAAKSGQRVYSREVFDGADEEGRNYISAFIGDAQTVTAPDGLKNGDMGSGKAWPIRMAFFAPDNKTGTPDYEMTMLLLENGVAAHLTIDYGDFSVGAALRSVEPLAPTCS